MNILVASAAFVMSGFIASSALAQSVIITNDGYHHQRYDDEGYGNRVYREDEDRGLHRGWRHGRHHGWNRGRCEIVEHRHWRHHRMIIERERVCDD